MASIKVEVERFTLTSTQSFEAVVAALEAGVGRPDYATFLSALKRAKNYADMESIINNTVSDSGLMLFIKFDAGGVLRMQSGLASPKMQRFLIGNPLIMKEMAKHVPEAAGYAPITILVDERSDGVHLGYDKMASFLAPYGNAEALAVARELDAKIEKLMRSAATA